MDIFWCVETNRLVSVSPCEECGGYYWRILGERTKGIWMDFGCWPHLPDEPKFLRIRSGAGLTQQSPVPEGGPK